MKNTPEDDLHIAICDHIRSKYPEVIFTSESSGQFTGNGRIGIFRANLLKRKRSRGKLADIWVMEPNKECHALVMEVKIKSPYLANGKLSTQEHLQKQNEILLALQRKGYQACFVWSLNQAKEIIDNYMANR